jgi:hypothetical protein
MARPISDRFVLTREPSGDFEKSRDLVWRCYIGDFRNIALNDRLIDLM